MNWNFRDLETTINIFSFIYQEIKSERRLNFGLFWIFVKVLPFVAHFIPVSFIVFLLSVILVSVVTAAVVVSAFVFNVSVVSSLIFPKAWCANWNRARLNTQIGSWYTISSKYRQIKRNECDSYIVSSVDYKYYI